MVIDNKYDLSSLNGARLKVLNNIIKTMPLKIKIILLLHKIYTKRNYVFSLQAVVFLVAGKGNNMGVLLMYALYCSPNNAIRSYSSK